MSKLTIFHGSQEILEKPVHGKGKEYNDYGKGFYCTEHIELAREWACTESNDGYVNRYEINTSGLNILNLSEGRYSILHLLALLVNNRRFRISTPLMKQGTLWLMDNYLIDTDNYDAITGYRADDSYFSFAKAFLNNEISLDQLSYAMHLGKPGEQFVLKSEKAFSELKFVSYESADHTEYYARRKARDTEARSSYQKELERNSTDSLYMIDILRMEVKENDPRI